MFIKVPGFLTYSHIVTHDWYIYIYTCLCHIYSIHMPAFKTGIWQHGLGDREGSRIQPLHWDISMGHTGSFRSPNHGENKSGSNPFRGTTLQDSYRPIQKSEVWWPSPQIPQASIHPGEQSGGKLPVLKVAPWFSPRFPHTDGNEKLLKSFQIIANPSALKSPNIPRLSQAPSVCGISGCTCHSTLLDHGNVSAIGIAEVLGKAKINNVDLVMLPWHWDVGFPAGMLVP